MRRPARPQLEPLEAMTLLSGAAAALHHSGHAEVANTTGMAITLSGTERGVFLEHQNSTGTMYNLFTSGRFSPLGASALTGNLHVTTGLSSGPPNGTLHLAARHGTLTLQVPESVMIPAGVPSPTSANEIVDTYIVTGGTGAFQGDTGSGVVEFTFHSAARFGRSSVGRVTVSFSPFLPPTT